MNEQEYDNLKSKASEIIQSPNAISRVVRLLAKLERARLTSKAAHEKAQRVSMDSLHERWKLASLRNNIRYAITCTTSLRLYSDLKIDDTDARGVDMLAQEILRLRKILKEVGQ